MNILFYYDLTISSRHGGIAQVTISLAKQFRKEGHNVYFISAKETFSAEFTEQYYLPIKSHNKANENKQYFHGFLKKYKIDIIINQMGTTPNKNEAIIWGKEAKIPVITVIHNSLYGIYGVHSKILIKYQSIINRLHIQKLLSKFTHYYFKCKYGKCYKEQAIDSSRIILLSEKFKSEYEYFADLQTNNITCIPNPLTLESENLTITKKRKEILFVGRISYEKRVDLLLNIWNLLQDKHIDWNLTIVGDGLLKEKMQKKASKLHLKRVSFEGYKDPTSYYERASIFCMTSAFEGFGLVLVEAMSCGTVPFAFNSYANVSEIIDDKKNGYLITPFSTEEYALKLSHLMKDDKQRLIMAENAIIKSNTYKIDIISKQWNILFESLNKVIISQKNENT